MQVREGMVVQAKAGKEKGGWYVVVKTEDHFVWIANGHQRTLDRPKRKNVRHISPTTLVWEMEGLTDRALRQKLRVLPDGKGGK